MIPTFLISIITGEAAEAANRARRSAIEYAVASIFALFGFCFLLLAGYILAARHYGDLIAALAFGAGFLAIAVGLLIYHRIRARARARRAKERWSSEAKAMAGAAALAALPALASKRGGLAGLVLPVLAAAGYAIYRENSRRTDPVDDDLD